LKNVDPLISDTLNRALEEKEISPKEAEILYNANGLDLHLIGAVADELRKRRVGNKVTYVVNRNINFTNVCIKQCGFCAFSRDFREGEAYFIPTNAFAILISNSIRGHISSFFLNCLLFFFRV